MRAADRAEAPVLPKASRRMTSMPQRQRLCHCGALKHTPPARRWLCELPKLPSVRMIAAAAEPPVMVAMAVLKSAMSRSWSMRSIIVSTISRALSQLTTIPARICPSSMRLAISIIPLSMPRQALLRS